MNREDYLNWINRIGDLTKAVVTTTPESYHILEQLNKASKQQLMGMLPQQPEAVNWIKENVKHEPLALSEKKAAPTIHQWANYWRSKSTKKDEVSDTPPPPKSSAGAAISAGFNESTGASGLSQGLSNLASAFGLGKSELAKSLLEYIELRKSAIAKFRNHYKSKLRRVLPVGTQMDGKKKVMIDGKAKWRSMRSGMTSDSKGQAISVREANAETQKGK